MIYFVVQQDKYVKIGFADKNPKERLRALQCGNPHPLKILKIIEGGFDLEKELHKRFRAARIKKEWFNLTDELRSYIKSTKRSEWKPKPRKVYFRQTTKKQITLRIDEDILDWFKSQGKGYQSKINDVLRNWMNGMTEVDNSVPKIPEHEEIKPPPIAHAQTNFFRPMPIKGK